MLFLPFFKEINYIRVIQRFPYSCDIQLRMKEVAYSISLLIIANYHATCIKYMYHNGWMPNLPIFIINSKAMILTQTNISQNFIIPMKSSRQLITLSQSPCSPCKIYIMYSKSVLTFSMHMFDKLSCKAFGLYMRYKYSFSALNQRIKTSGKTAISFDTRLLVLYKCI